MNTWGIIKMVIFCECSEYQLVDNIILCYSEVRDIIIVVWRFKEKNIDIYPAQQKWKNNTLVLK